MKYSKPPLVMDETSITDALTTVHIDDLPDPEPQCPVRLSNTTPLIERMWRIALSDIEENIVTNNGVEYFGAGKTFGLTIYTRDIALSGILGLNMLYPEIMRRSLEHTRNVRLEMGFLVPEDEVPQGLDINWIPDMPDNKSFRMKYHTNGYQRRTDDVVWLWAMEDLFTQDKAADADWQWMYETGLTCFEQLYDPFFDKADGLYMGESLFVDIGSAYREDLSRTDCIRVKASSTNAIYVRGMQVMARTAEKLGKQGESGQWNKRAEDLKQAMIKELRNDDGTFAYFKHPDGSLEPRRHNLADAMPVLLDIVTGEDAERAVAGYPVTDAGIPLIDPFYDNDGWYHNNSSWPFADEFFLLAQEKATGESTAAQSMALLGRTLQVDGTFHEVVDIRDKAVKGSASQLWTAAAFVNACRRAGLI